MSESRLIALLANGEWLSGQSAGEAMGVSRAAVWKQIRKLCDNFGIPLESARGLGYRVPGGLDLLRGEALKTQLLTPSSPWQSIEVVNSLGSTNDHLVGMLKSGLAGGHVCLAEHQTAGRGRRGRQWVSPFASNLYLSASWGFSGGAGALEGLSLAVGLAVRRALCRVGCDGIRLKWPNDILHEGKKLGGILLEMTGDATGHCSVVIGIGLNVAMTDMQADNEIDQPWTTVRNILDTPLARTTLAIEVLNALGEMLQAFEAQGFPSLMAEWHAADYLRGESVIVHAGEDAWVGEALGVSEQGALRVMTPSGEQRLYGGEVSIRKRPT